MKSKCLVCGNEFESKKSTAKYCSSTCEYKMRKIRQQNKIQENLKQCPICQNFFTPKSPLANQRICCYNCMEEGIQLTRGAFLAKIKEKRGGACVRCGYNKCIKALEFHHINPKEKEFTISNDHFKLLDVTKEIKKCVLICSNCHKELHDGMWNIEDLKKEEVNLDSN